MVLDCLKCRYRDKYVPQRYILCFMLFMGVVLNYSSRACLNIALTEMVKLTEKNESGDTKHLCPEAREKLELPIKKLHTEFDWSEKEQNFILASFFPGYVITHLPGGIMADNLGGKHIFAGGVFISAICSFISPLSADYGGWLYISILRIITGISQGPMFPAMMSIISKWSPKNERSCLGSFAFTGVQVGSVAGNFITSHLIGFEGRWRLPFYFWGIVSFFWYLLFLVIGYSYPKDSPFITREELEFLEQEIGPREIFKVPWFAITFSAPVWSIVCASLGHDILFFFLTVQLPKYFSNVLGFHIKRTGFWTSIPFLTLFICSNLSAYLSDKIISKNIWTLDSTRRIFCVIGCVLPSMFVMFGSYAGCQQLLSAICMTLSLTSMCTFYPSIRINSLDLSKNFSGIIMAVVNGVGALAYLPFPPLTAAIVKNHSPEEWRKIIWIMAIISAVSCFTFVFFGATERQSWDIPPSSS